MMSDLIKHAKEFASALRSKRYEPVGNGQILFPQQKVLVSGLYSHRIRGKTDWQHDPNLLPTEGLNYVLDSFVSSHAAIPLYLSLYGSNSAPAANWTQASYPGSYSEISGSPEGYTEGTRPVWTAAAATSATKDNYASPASFTIVTASSLNVYGCALHTNSTKLSTSGSLISATLFSSVRVFANTDVFDVKYRIALTSS